VTNTSCPQSDVDVGSAIEITHAFSAARQLRVRSQMLAQLKPSLSRVRASGSNLTLGTRVGRFRACRVL